MPISWRTRVNAEGEEQVAMFDPAWAVLVSLVAARIKDEVMHFLLKQDLVEHISQQHENQYINYK